MNIKTVKITKASSAWHEKKDGDNVKMGGVSFNVYNWDVEQEQELGFYGASGHLVDFQLDHIELKAMPVKVSSTIKRIVEDGDPVRVTTISTSFEDDRGEIDAIGEHLLGEDVEVKITFLQASLPLKSAIDKFIAPVNDPNSGIDSVTLSSGEDSVTIGASEA